MKPLKSEERLTLEIINRIESEIINYIVKNPINNVPQHGLCMFIEIAYNYDEIHCDKIIELFYQELTWYQKLQLKLLIRINNISPNYNKLSSEYWFTRPNKNKDFKKFYKPRLRFLNKIRKKLIK